MALQCGSFRIAVDRPFNSQSGEREADFINIVVWNKAAENTAKYMSKGRQIAVEGRLQIRSYDGNDGQRRWVTEVVADRVEFLGGGSGNAGGGNYGGNNYGGQPQNNYQRQNDQFSQPAAPAIMVWALSAPKSASVTKICRSNEPYRVRQ